MPMITRALFCLPVAAGLGGVLAFRPRRVGTPERSAPVIQTQIVLAVIGAVIMLIVGSSTSRAFAVAGAASLIRYQAGIDDPKDAVVMLTTLSIGLAVGVQLYGVAAFGTLFILGVLWVVESLEPELQKTYELTVRDADSYAVRPSVEALLADYHAEYELRGGSASQLVYLVRLPASTRVGRISTKLLRLTDGEEHGVKWKESKAKS